MKIDQKRVKKLIENYKSVVKIVDSDAKDSKQRAYGGVIRAVKGKLQEHITQEIIEIAWNSIGGSLERISINSKKIEIPIKRDYVLKVDDRVVKEHILSNIDEYFFRASVDKHVFIDDKMVMGIECKAYTENAMVKRIMVDFSLIKRVVPKMSCYLFQLESQLGGDYSKLKRIEFGSKSTHTLMSYFPKVKLNIFTFLKGERKVDRPIHKKGNFKSLTKKRVIEAIKIMATDLKEYV